MVTKTLIAKSGSGGSWKQHPDEVKAKRFFDSLSDCEKDNIMDGLVLGEGMDWLDYDMPQPSKVFRSYFYRLIEEYDQF